MYRKRERSERTEESGIVTKEPVDSYSSVTLPIRSVRKGIIDSPRYRNDRFPSRWKFSGRKYSKRWNLIGNGYRRGDGNAGADPELSRLGRKSGRVSENKGYSRGISEAVRETSSNNRSTNIASVQWPACDANQRSQREFAERKKTDVSVAVIEEVVAARGRTPFEIHPLPRDEWNVNVKGRGRVESSYDSVHVRTLFCPTVRADQSGFSLFPLSPPCHALVAPNSLAFSVSLCSAAKFQPDVRKVKGSAEMNV